MSGAHNFLRLLMAAALARRAEAASEVWSEGDLAICVRDRWRQLCSHCPKREELLRVSKVAQHEGTMLAFVGKPQDHFWDAIGFRKIRPQHEPADTEFQELLRERLSKGTAR